MGIFPWILFGTGLGVGALGEHAFGSVLEGRSYLDRLVAHYGVTMAPELAGWLLPDGTFLDFSEGSGSRAQDHRNVNWVLPGGTERERESRYEGMARVATAAKMYRWMPESWSIEAWTAPTREQLFAIRQLADLRELSLEAHKGRWEFYREYERWEGEQAADDLRAFYGGSRRLAHRR